MSIRCRLGLHAWKITEGERLTAKAGILYPGIVRGMRCCVRCDASVPVHKSSGLFGEGKWIVTTAPAEAAISEGWLLYDDWRAWRRAEDEAKLAKFEGTACKCGGTWRRVESDHTWRTWVGLECSNRCYATTPACHFVDKPFLGVPQKEVHPVHG